MRHGETRLAYSWRLCSMSAFVTSLLRPGIWTFVAMMRCCVSAGEECDDVVELEG